MSFISIGNQQHLAHLFHRAPLPEPHPLHGTPGFHGLPPSEPSSDDVLKALAPDAANPASNSVGADDAGLGMGAEEVKENAITRGLKAMTPGQFLGGVAVIGALGFAAKTLK